MNRKLKVNLYFSTLKPDFKTLNQFVINFFLWYFSNPKINNKHEADMLNVLKVQKQSFGDVLKKS